MNGQGKKNRFPVVASLTYSSKRFGLGFGYGFGFELAKGAKFSTPNQKNAVLLSGKL